VALDTPDPFWAIGRFYSNFAQTTDQEVLDHLERNHRRTVEVEAGVGQLSLPGSLTTPSAPAGVVVFAHGSGSSRFSPRNREVADVLHRAGLATLLFDLLTAEEAHDRSKVFDVEMLAYRLVEVTEWLRAVPEMRSLPVGYFGASTGAAAALLAAADPRSNVFAVVSRGGRPDLALDQLSNVRAPTLLIVGGDDHVVLGLNRRALAVLRCEADLAVVPGAGHLFEEPGTLQAAADLARRWFVDHLPFERGGGRGVTRG
jgi:putative phosphoribosyl transferase